MNRARAPVVLWPRGRRGSVLLLAIFFLFVLGLITYGFLVLIPAQAGGARRLLLETQAYLAADAGIRDSVLWLQATCTAGDEPIPVPPSTVRNGTLSGEWNWQVTITPDAATPPNGTSPLRFYNLRAEGRSGNQPLRVINASVGQESFARYCRLTDRWPQYNGQTVWISAGTMSYSGPLHINDAINVLDADPSFFSGTGPILFNGPVSSATFTGSSVGDGINYSSYTPYDSNGNPNASDYNRLFAGGRAALKTGVERIELPVDSVNEGRVAWGASSGQPPTDGVYINPDVNNKPAGGVYMRGNIDKIVMAVDAGGNPTMTITQGGQNYQVIEVRETALTAPVPAAVGSTVLVKPAGAPQVLDGLPNGMIYGTGNVLAFEGTNKYGHTLTTDGEIVLSGSVLRADTAADANPTSRRDALGIVASQLRIPTSIPTGGTPLYLYGAIVAGRKGQSGGGIVVDDPQMQPAGTIKIYGSLVESQKNLWSYGGGYANQFFNYDPQMANEPPPWLPSTGRFILKAWKEEAIDGGASF